jgi:pimeloyl-ACP methyl ester carboxylesterase
VYFLEPYDRRKIPVLFVHGINGSPANFTYLIEHLDRRRFQPWVYYYPSGVHLAAIADHLNQTMAKLELRYRFPRFAVVAHSMGGLVSRGFILRHAQTAKAERIPLYVTLSTPWQGHKGAEIGIKYSPAVVRVWIDMAPGSDYLKSLFASPLPAGMAHHLVFTFKGSASGESGDGVVTVASQMYPEAQREAVRLYGFDDTHDGVLSNKDASALLNDLLARSY